MKWCCCEHMAKVKLAGFFSPNVLHHLLSIWILLYCGSGKRSGYNHLYFKEAEVSIRQLLEHIIDILVDPVFILPNWGRCFGCLKVRKVEALVYLCLEELNLHPEGNPDCVKTVLSILVKTFCFFILDDDSSGLDNMLQAWMLPLGCLDHYLCAFLRVLFWSVTCSFLRDRLLVVPVFPCSFGQIFWL